MKWNEWYKICEEEIRISCSEYTPSMFLFLSYPKIVEFIEKNSKKQTMLFQCYFFFVAQKCIDYHPDLIIHTPFTQYSNKKIYHFIVVLYNYSTIANNE